MAEKLLTAEEVADWVQLTPEWVQEQARRGRIPALRLGRFWRFEPDAVDRWLKYALVNDSSAASSASQSGYCGDASPPASNFLRPQRRSVPDECRRAIRLRNRTHTPTAARA